MEFTVRKSDLVRELSLLQGVVEKRTTIPILSNVLIRAHGECVVLMATDLELGIRSACPARVVREGASTLPVRRLLDYVRLLPDVDVSFKFLENDWAAVNCGRSRTRIAGISGQSFPELPEMTEPFASLPVAVLTGMITRTIFAISVQESRLAVNGSLLILRGTGACMVATDGHRLAYVEVDAEIPGVKVPHRDVLPKKAMTEILKLAQDAGPTATVQFAASDNHLFFALGDRLLVTRKLTGSFPDFERVLPKESAVTVVVSRDEVREAIERVAQFSDERSHAMRIELNRDEVRLYSSASETGDSEEVVPAEYQGDRFEVGFNANYILDFLRATSEERVIFGFRDSHSAAELRPAGDQGPYRYRYVLMPMRI